MKFTIIAAIDNNGALGIEGKLPWKISEDLQFFKQKTEGHYVVMGRKTYESLPKKLENRSVIVLTTQQEYDPKDEDVTVCHSVGEAVLLLHRADADHVYICGGGNVYSQFVGYADHLLITRVDTYINGADAFFPLVQLGGWKLDSIKPQQDTSSDYTYYFETYSRA